MIPERLPALTRNPRKLVNAVRASSRDSDDKTRTQFEYAPENYTLTRESLRAIIRVYKQIDSYSIIIIARDAQACVAFLRNCSVHLCVICDLYKSVSKEIQFQGTHMLLRELPREQKDLKKIKLQAGFISSSFTLTGIR